MEVRKRSSGVAERNLSAASERESGVSRAAAVAQDSIGGRNPPAASDGPQPLALLLVEDSDTDAKLLLYELRRGGYKPTCECVATQTAFRAALESEAWDVVVADYSLPGYGGLVALADLKASGQDIPFILVSGTIGESVAVEAMKAGAQDYVLKQDLTRLPVAIGRELREKAIRADQARMREQIWISERMASAGMLAAGLAHEVNNPLAVAVGNLEYIADKLGLLTARAGQYAAAHDDDRWDTCKNLLDQLNVPLRDAGEGLRRVRDIVADVKLFARPLDDACAPQDLRKIADSSIRMARNEIRHRATLVKDYGEVPMVQANGSRLGQVILNLVVNAAQAIPAGQVDANEIRVVTGTGERGLALLEVSDTGCGISEENRERIFDAFFTTKAPGVGTGLGLAICHRIVTELGGRIEVDSVVGKGTVIRLLLPPAVDAPKAAQPQEPQRPQSRKARVLLVDDEAAMARTMERSLSDFHEVVALTSARQALARIAAGERFDVILSDVMMPLVTGMEFHRRLEQLAPDQARRVVFMTGGAFTAQAREYLDCIPNRHIQKPFDRATLLAVIAEIHARGRA